VIRRAVLFVLVLEALAAAIVTIAILWDAILGLRSIRMNPPVEAEIRQMQVQSLLYTLKMISFPMIVLVGSCFAIRQLALCQPKGMQSCKLPNCKGRGGAS
jgi:ethanolamine transporter EutH